MPKRQKVMDTDKCKIKTNISINGEKLENVDSFKYLGAKIQNDGRSENEIHRRTAIASQKLNHLNKVWKG